MRDVRLSTQEAQLWHAWKRAGEAVMARVGRDLTEATGLSGGDYGVLSRLVDLGDGTLRQQALAESLGWDKSRLSHQLTRMTARGLVRRKAAGAKGVDIELSAAGRKAIDAARAVHARAIRAHLVGPLTAAEADQLLALCERLAAEP